MIVAAHSKVTVENSKPTPWRSPKTAPDASAYIFAAGNHINAKTKKRRFNVPEIFEAKETI